MTRAEFRRLLLKLFLPLLNGADLLPPEGLQRLDELLLGALQHPILLILDGRDQLAELLQAGRDDDLVVGLAIPDALELEVDESLAELPLAVGERLGGREQRLDLLDEVLDGRRGPLELLLVAVQRVSEVGAVLEAVGELQRQQTHFKVLSCFKITSYLKRIEKIKRILISLYREEQTAKMFDSQWNEFGTTPIVSKVPRDISISIARFKYSVQSIC